MQEELDEAVQFCDLMVVGHPEDALDRSKRAKNFYALDVGRLVVALRRYREVDQSYFGHSPQLPKVTTRAARHSLAPFALEFTVAMCPLQIPPVSRKDCCVQELVKRKTVDGVIAKLKLELAAITQARNSREGLGN